MRVDTGTNGSLVPEQLGELLEAHVRFEERELSRLSKPLWIARL
jgi:hypothetical protein